MCNLFQNWQDIGIPTVLVHPKKTHLWILYELYVHLILNQVNAHIKRENNKLTVRYQEQTNGLLKTAVSHALQLSVLNNLKGEVLWK